MLSFLSENIGTIAVLLVLAAVSLLIVLRLLKNKKEGKSSCSCGGSCSACPMGSLCHSASSLSKPECECGCNKSDSVSEN